ncbi:hypothetical protein HK098_004442 [Nowakowskiella sp. JEL0407]|nr:hypothetical protein HK098_004442 [Nowakowskiella sp. JEL0407]
MQLLQEMSSPISSRDKLDKAQIVAQNDFEKDLICSQITKARLDFDQYYKTPTKKLASSSPFFRNSQLSPSRQFPKFQQMHSPPRKIIFKKTSNLSTTPTKVVRKEFPVNTFPEIKEPSNNTSKEQLSQNQRKVFKYLLQKVKTLEEKLKEKEQTQITDSNAPIDYSSLQLAGLDDGAKARVLDSLIRQKKKSVAVTVNEIKTLEAQRNLCLENIRAASTRTIRFAPAVKADEDEEMQYGHDGSVGS